jgi:putative salt-induced outer membrane protein YdiY
MKRGLQLILIAMLFAIPAGAAVVHLKNGDQVTGDLERVQNNTVFLKSESFGEVQIPLDKVQSLTVTEPGVVLLTNGEEVEGNFTLLPGGDWEVETSSGKRKIASKSVVIIYPAKTFHAKKYGEKHKLWQDWKGTGALGYSLVRGDQNAKTLSIDFNASRRVPALAELSERARTNFFLNLIFANTESAGVKVSANSFTAGIRQDFKFTNKNFWFLLAQADHSQPQSLNLRQTYGGGIGRDLIKRARFDLQGIGGLTYVDEHFVGQVIRKNAEALIGEKVGWKMTRWLNFAHALSFYPSVTHGGGYRIDSTTGLTTQITKRFSFNTTYTDHYLSAPLPGHRPNEVILTTGLGVNF